MAKSKNPKPRPAPWPAWPEYPGHAVMQAIDWTEWTAMHGGWGSSREVRPTAATARVMADWLEEHGLPQLAALWRHWADCWPRVRAADLDSYEAEQRSVGLLLHPIHGSWDPASLAAFEAMDGRSMAVGRWEQAGVRWQLQADYVGSRPRTGGPRPAAAGDYQPSQ